MNTPTLIYTCTQYSLHPKWLIIVQHLHLQIILDWYRVAFISSLSKVLKFYFQIITEVICHISLTWWNHRLYVIFYIFYEVLQILIDSFYFKWRKLFWICSKFHKNFLLDSPIGMVIITNNGVDNKCLFQALQYPVWNALHILTYLIIITTLSGYCYSHFTDEQTKVKQFALITQLISGRTDIWSDAFRSR